MAQIFPDAVYVERYVTGSWSDMSSFVVSDLEIEYLIPSNDEGEKLAAVGELSFIVNNGDGSFSPNSNFQRGTPIRVRVVYDGTSRTRLLGTILDLDPDSGEWGDQYVDVVVVDWMALAVNYPLYVPEIQTNMRVDEAVAYLLSLMRNQPESVEYHTGRETFTAVFDTIKQETRTYSELNKLALSEFAPIYLKAGNVLVVESADTRHGMRELSTVPIRYSDSHALLWNGTGTTNGVVALQENGFPIFADVRYEPRLSGTYSNVEIEHGSALINQVLVRAYPSRVDATLQTLFQLDAPIKIPSLGTVEVKGTYANPDGGEPINATNLQPLVTGSSYQFFANEDGTGSEYTSNLVITEGFGAEGFIHSIRNNGIAGWLTKLTAVGYGIYPYNPVEFLLSVTGSVTSQGVSQLEISQKYQDSIGAGIVIANSIADREKDPRNQLLSATFIPNNSIDLMQASQYMDIGDLVYVPNAKPPLDTYAYIQGKKLTISLGGGMTETWYLKEMDSLRKGLQPVALRFSGLFANMNGVNFGIPPKTSNLSKKTICGWVKNVGAGDNYPILSKYGGDDAASDGWYFFVFGNGHLHYRENFDPNDGLWNSANPVMTGSFGTWHHIALSYDNTDLTTNPKMYLDGVPILVTGSASAPTGFVQDDSTSNLILGNISYTGFNYVYSPNTILKDVRLYNRILTPQELMELASNPNNHLLVPNGLVFQTPCVRTEDYGILTGTVLYPQNKLIDNMFGVVGTPNWNFPSGTNYGLRIQDPLT